MRRLKRVRDWIKARSAAATLHRKRTTKRTKIETDIKFFTPAQFRRYCQQFVKPKMGAWRPRGVVIHNTDVPRLSEWPRVDGLQRMRNLQSYYEGLGWNGTPHLFIAPEGIYVLNPLWKRGTHSPSFNATHYGVEFVGNMDAEALPAAEKSNGEQAIACLYELMGTRPVLGLADKAGVKAGNLFFHKDDPRTTHKMCPGKNLGTKMDWVGSVSRIMAGMGVKEDAPAAVGLLSPGAVTEPGSGQSSDIHPFEDIPEDDAACERCDELKISGEEVVETLPGPAKPWYESRAQVAGIVGALAVLAGAAGFKMNESQQEGWTTALTVLIPLGISLVTHMVQMWGRWRANAPIKGGPGDPIVIAQAARLEETRRELLGHE
jgi:N-acetylmuramoyl-L-alanine amidase